VTLLTSGYLRMFSRERLISVLLQHDADGRQQALPARWLATGALAAIGVSIAVMAWVGLQGRSAAVPLLPNSSGWPPYSLAVHPSPAQTSVEIWAAVLLGSAGLAAGLLAARRGWRPGSRPLVIGAAIAVVALMLVPSVGSTDLLDYAVYGRIAALGHSPYVMTPLQLKHTGDPVGQIAPHPWDNNPSVYGPLGTASEWAASALSGSSAPRTVFWLKAWNALAFLAVAMALGWTFRRDPARRTRAHLLWSVNPLMLFAVMAGGHVDGLAAALGVFGVLALRRINVARGLLAGVLVGAAIAIKAPFAFFGLGLAWAARRSPWTLVALGAGAAAVLIPSYLVAGPKAIAAVAGRAASSGDLYEPWQLLGRVAGWPQAQTAAPLDDVALLASLVLAVILLWRLPAGPPGLASVRPALALSLAWLFLSPQQRPWFDAMIFPLLALMPVTRLDWIAVLRLAAATLAELPGVTYFLYLKPVWLFGTVNIIARWIAPILLVIALIATLWLCFTGRWTSGREGDDAAAPAELPPTRITPFRDLPVPGQ
jgi:hypothetical protein